MQPLEVHELQVGMVVTTLLKATIFAPLRELLAFDQPSSLADLFACTKKYVT